MQKYFILPILVLISAAAVSPPASVRAHDLDVAAIAAPAVLVDNGGYAVKKNGNIVAAHNLHTLYVPASIIKIATALAALDILGPEFRFHTSFYLDEKQNLYIQGFGDPFLISEEVAAVVRKLKELGCTTINDIYLDDTAFQLAASTDGAGASDNPYDAQNSALAVNFNTINVRKERSGPVLSAEEQTPTLALMAELADKLEPGRYRLNVTTAETGGAEIISRYAGELFRAFQKLRNIAGEGVIARRKTPGSLKPFYTHRAGRNLEDIIGPLMHYSNNFIANQLFLTLGAHEYGYPATWEKSIQVMAEYLRRKYNLSAPEIKIIEGSGLSRKNQAAPHAMIQLLDSFKPYAKLLPQKNGKIVKSGTLDGVYAYAGYFMEKERLDSFVLLLNQEKNNRDLLLDVLQRIYSAP